MKIDVPTHHDAPTPKILGMLVEQEFHEEKCRRGHAVEYDVEVSQDGARTHIVVNRTMPTEGLPELLRSFAKDGVKVQETVSWGPVADDGSRVADIQVRFIGQPLKMIATLTVGPAGAGTDGRVLGDLKASVPLVGGKIERATAPQIIAAIDIEQDILSDWLAAGR